MKQAVRHQVIRVLEAAAMRLLAGTVAYPPKMYEDIIKRVEQQYMNWSLFMCDEIEKDLQGKLDVLQPKADTTFPLPTFSPAVWKQVRTQAEILLAIKDGKEPTTKLAKRATNEQVMTEFVRNMTGKSRFDYGQEKSTGLPDTVWAAVEKLKTAKKMNGLDDSTIKVMNALLWTVAYTAYSNAADKSARILRNWVDDKKEFEGRKAASMNDAGPGDDPTKIEPVAKSLKETQELRKYLVEQGAKPESPNKKRPKTSKKKGGAKVEWKIPVDITGLPAKYPLEAAKTTLKEITVVFMAARASYAGSWHPEKHILTLLASNIAVDVDRFTVSLQSMKSTLKHELSHMVQSLMKETLRAQGKKSAAERAGTAFDPKHPVPPEPEPEEIPDDDDDDDDEGASGEKEGHHKPKFDRYANLRKTYPEAKERELYFLSPVEYYPQIGSWVHQFIKHRPAAGETPEAMMKRWKEFVGITPGYIDSDFYKALKTHDKRLWKKAVGEGWKLLQKQLEKNAAKAKPA